MRIEHFPSHGSLFSSLFFFFFVMTFAALYTISTLFLRLEDLFFRDFSSSSERHHVGEKALYSCSFSIKKNYYF